MAAMMSIAFPRSLLALALFGLLADAGPAAAQKVERLGDFNDWAAFRFVENGNKACYIASKPKKHEGKYQERGDIYALVTHRPAEKRRDEVSFIIGFKFKPDSDLQVSIGNKKFTLFTKDDGAWTANAEQDQAMVKSMIRGSTMVVRGESWRGTKTKDTYSLRGFTKAYNTINNSCGIK